MGEESAEASVQERDSSDTDSVTPPSQSADTKESIAEQQSGGVNRKEKSSRTASSGASVHRAATGSEGTSATAGHLYADYDSGPNHQALSERYGLSFCKRGQAQKVQRLESEFGSDRVSRWTDEGMTVETMGKPQDMEAFRERQEGRPTEVPTDIERQNQASLQRNKDAAQDDSSTGDVGAPDAVRRVISSPGTSMDENVQREMESKVGGDFSDVQLHTGPQAAAAAESINARAFTAGNHVAFNRGEYQPDSDSGKRVLAHELTHVRQQTDGRVSLLPKAGTEHPGAGMHVGEGVHVQPKLEVSSPNDPAEKEAEQVAEAVMKMDDDVASPDTDSDSREERAARTERDSGLIRTVPVNRSGGGAVDEGTESQVRSAVQGGGKPLPADTRANFESKMGADFSDVKVHTGSEASEAASSINAEAYTMGSNIAFADGKYNPKSNAGKQLLAHELTHVTQQGGTDCSALLRSAMDYSGESVSGVFQDNYKEETVRGDVNLNNATVGKYQFLRGAEITGDVWGVHSTLDNTLRRGGPFMWAEISGDVNLRHATIDDEHAFSHAEIGGDLNISNATIEADESFRSTRVEGDLDASSVTVRGDEVAAHANVRGNADVSNASLHGDDAFYSLRTGGWLDTQYTAISGENVFLGANVGADTDAIKEDIVEALANESSGSYDEGEDTATWWNGADRYVVTQETSENVRNSMESTMQEIQFNANALKAGWRAHPSTPDEGGEMGLSDQMITAIVEIGNEPPDVRADLEAIERNLERAQQWLESGNLNCVNRIQNAVSRYNRVSEEWNQYVERSIGNTSAMITGLEYTKVAGQVAAGVAFTVATGGAGGVAAGSGLSASYGAIQDSAQAGSEMAYGLRDEFPLGEIAGDAVFNFVVGLGTGHLGNKISDAFGGVDYSVIDVETHIIDQIVGASPDIIGEVVANDALNFVREACREVKDALGAQDIEGEELLEHVAQRLAENPHLLELLAEADPIVEPPAN